MRFTSGFIVILAVQLNILNMNGSHIIMTTAVISATAPISTITRIAIGIPITKPRFTALIDGDIVGDGDDGDIIVAMCIGVLDKETSRSARTTYRQYLMLLICRWITCTVMYCTHLKW